MWESNLTEQTASMTHFFPVSLMGLCDHQCNVLKSFSWHGTQVHVMSFLNTEKVVSVKRCVVVGPVLDEI